MLNTVWAAVHDTLADRVVVELDKNTLLKIEETTAMDNLT